MALGDSADAVTTPMAALSRFAPNNSNPSSGVFTSLAQMGAYPGVSFNARMVVRSISIDVSEGDTDGTGASQTFTLPTPTSMGTGILLGALGSVENAFTGGGASAVSMQVGDSSDPDGLVTALDVFSGGVNPLVFNGADYGALQTHDTYTPQVVLTVTGANVEDLTTGSAFVFFVFLVFEGTNPDDN